MEIGDIYIHKKFEFSDTSLTRKKFFIVLNEPSGNNPYLIIKTTSNLRNRNYATGCNPRYEEFFIPGGNLFPIDTLLQLMDFGYISIEKFHSGLMKEKTIKKFGSLRKTHWTKIIFCYHELKDIIHEKYFNMIGSTK